MPAAPIWIDCDCGVDDAQAIMATLADARASLQGISAVHGNASCDQVARNVARVLTLAGR